MGAGLGGKFVKDSSMQMPWRLDLVVAGGVAVLLLLRHVVVTIQKKKKKAQASLDPNNNEDEVEHEENIVAETHSKLKDEKEESFGSSMAVMPTRSMTFEDEALLGEAEELNEGVGSPNKELWTAHAIRDSTTEELSVTALQERLTEMKETMRERVVRDGWYVYRREWVRFGRKIGEGGQAEVYAATAYFPSTGSSATFPQDVAVKKFKSVKGVSQGHNPPGLRSLKCMHVCQPLGVFYDKGQLCLIMPRFPGDLRSAIDKEMGLHQAPPFPEPVAMHIIMQLAMGLRGLHEVGIHHRDLKASNVLVEKMKIGDLESYGVYISDFESSEDVIGTGFYRAPEVLRRVQDRMQGRVHGPVRIPEQEWAAADVYSFGMVCSEILTGNVPKIGKEWYDYSKALSGQRPELPPDVVPEGLRIIIQGCWHEDPECRPKPNEIIHLLMKIGNNNNRVARAWSFQIEAEAALEVTSASLEDDLLELQVLLLKHAATYGSRLTDRYPPYFISGMEFSNHVREFIPKFHAFSYLPQQSFPLQKFMELRKLLMLIDWTKCCFWREEEERSQVASDDEVYCWQRTRMKFLIRRVHAATNKTILQRTRLAPQERRLHINEKLLILQDFVVSLLSAGVFMQHVWLESEIVIRQLDERWALRLLLNGSCMVHWLRREIRLFIPSLLSFVFISQILCRILLGWYLNLSSAISFRLFLLEYIGYRAHDLWYDRFLYSCTIGNGEGFKYWFLYRFLCSVKHNYVAYKQLDFTPHCDFEPINSSTY